MLLCYATSPRGIFIDSWCSGIAGGASGKDGGQAGLSVPPLPSPPSRPTGMGLGGVGKGMGAQVLLSWRVEAEAFPWKGLLLFLLFCGP